MECYNVDCQRKITVAERFYVCNGGLTYHVKCAPANSRLADNLDRSKEAKEEINHPSRYNQGGIECIDALASATINLKGIEAFDTANVIKYLWRWKDKGGKQDLEKAKWYLEHLIKQLP